MQKECFALYHGDPSVEDSIGFAKQCLDRMVQNLGCELLVSDKPKDEGITLQVLSA